MLFLIKFIALLGIARQFEVILEGIKRIQAKRILLTVVAGYFVGALFFFVLSKFMPYSIERCQQPIAISATTGITLA
jgi:hypothetical protein